MMITDAIISPLFKNLINRSGLHRLYLLFCWSGHVSTLGFPKSFTQWSKSSRYLVRVLRHSLLKHRSTSFTVNMHIFTSFFFTHLCIHICHTQQNSTIKTRMRFFPHLFVFCLFFCFVANPVPRQGLLETTLQRAGIQLHILREDPAACRPRGWHPRNSHGQHDFGMS